MMPSSSTAPICAFVGALGGTFVSAACCDKEKTDDGEDANRCLLCMCFVSPPSLDIPLLAAWDGAAEQPEANITSISPKHISIVTRHWCQRFVASSVSAFCTSPSVVPSLSPGHWRIITAPPTPQGEQTCSRRCRGRVTAGSTGGSGTRYPPHGPAPHEESANIQINYSTFGAQIAVELDG